jgi:hypothetical protein
MTLSLHQLIIAAASVVSFTALASVNVVHYSE